jgi:hypothetical protein
MTINMPKRLITYWFQNTSLLVISQKDKSLVRGEEVDRVEVQGPDEHQAGEEEEGPDEEVGVTDEDKCTYELEDEEGSDEDDE